MGRRPRNPALKTVRIAAAQTPEFREDLKVALAHATGLAARGDRCRETGLLLPSSDVTGERDGRI